MIFFIQIKLKNIYSSIDQAALLNDYFGITQAGEVYVKKDISSLGSGAVNFDIIAADGGGTQTQAAATVVVTPSTTTQTTTTTDRYSQANSSIA